MMRIYFYVLFFLLKLVTAIPISAQIPFPVHTSELSFGLNGIDRNFRADHWLHYGRQGFKFGLKYTVKHLPRDDQGFGYQGRAYPRKLPEHFGFQLGYSYEWLRFSKIGTSYFFYDLQVSHTSLILHAYEDTGIVLFDSLSQKEYELFVRYRGYYPPKVILEQNIGIGITIPIAKTLVLNQMAGVGFLIYQPQIGSKRSSLYPDYSPIYSFLRIGLCWKHYKKSKQ